MASILSKNSPTIGYVFEPDPKNRNVLTFAGTRNSPIPFLLESATMNFTRAASFKYFLNAANAALIRGYGQGTLSCSGLFGSMDDFETIFGSDKDNGCDNNTATLELMPMSDCDNKQTGVRKFTLTGITPVSIQVTTTIDQSGIYYCLANASFQFTGLTTN